MRVEGTVKVEATINDEGAVEDAKAVSGHALLVPAAVEAVKKFRTSGEAANPSRPSISNLCSSLGRTGPSTPDVSYDVVS